MSWKMYSVEHHEATVDRGAARAGKDGCESCEAGGNLTLYISSAASPSLALHLASLFNEVNCTHLISRIYEIYYNGIILKYVAFIIGRHCVTR